MLELSLTVLYASKQENEILAQFNRAPVNFFLVNFQNLSGERKYESLVVRDNKENFASSRQETQWSLKAIFKDFLMQSIRRQFSTV